MLKLYKRGDKMVRLKDIAEKAGVSTTTVSNVIHGRTSRVSKENIEKIQGLLEEAHYIPNKSLKNKDLNNLNFIGVVVAFSQRGEKKILEDPFFTEILATLEERIRQYGYYMMLYTAEESFDIFHLASNWILAGMIIFGFTGSDCVNLRKQTDVPFVTIDGYLEEKSRKNFVNIGLDDYNGGYQMAKLLLSYGHQKILFLSDSDETIDHTRWLGFQKALLEEKIACDDNSHFMIELNPTQRRLQYQSALSFFKSHSALFFSSDYYAVEAMNFFMDRGIAVPEQISIAGFDDNILAKLVRPSLTTVHQDISKKAELAMEDLILLINQETVEEKHKELPVHIVIRDSVKNLNE